MIVSRCVSLVGWLVDNQDPLVRNLDRNIKPLLGNQAAEFVKPIRQRDSGAATRIVT